MKIKKTYLVLSILFLIIINSFPVSALVYQDSPSQYAFSTNYCLGIELYKGLAVSYKSINSLEWLIPTDSTISFSWPRGQGGFSAGFIYDKSLLAESVYGPSANNTMFTQSRDLMDKNGNNAALFFGFPLDSQRSIGFTLEHNYYSSSRTVTQRDSPDKYHSWPDPSSVTDSLQYINPYRSLQETLRLEFGKKSPSGRMFSALGFDLSYINELDILHMSQTVNSNDILTGYGTNINIKYKTDIQNPSYIFIFAPYFNYNTRQGEFGFGLGLSAKAGIGSSRSDSGITNLYLQKSYPTPGAISLLQESYKVADTGKNQVFGGSANISFQVRILNFGGHIGYTANMEQINEKVGTDPVYDAEYTVDRNLGTFRYGFFIQIENPFSRHASWDLLLNYSFFENNKTEKITPIRINNKPLAPWEAPSTYSFKYNSGLDFNFMLGLNLYNNNTYFKIALYFQSREYNDSTSKESSGGIIVRFFVDIPSKSIPPRHASSKTYVPQIKQSYDWLKTIAPEKDQPYLNLFIEGDRFFRDQKYSMALQTYYTIYQEDPKNARTVYMASVICIMTGDKENAIKWLKYLISISPAMKEKIGADPVFNELRKEKNAADIFK